MEKQSAIPAWKLKVASVLLSLVLIMGLAWAASHFIQVNGETLHRKLVLKAYHARIKWFGRPKIGITEADPQLGWRHKPLSIGQHSLPYSFDVRYHIDGEGNRATNASYNLPKCLFVGCSYTFGHGVADDSNYVAMLQQAMPSYKLINAAVNAYGTGQAYLSMIRALARYKDVRLVVYPFINHHLHRNYLRKGWLEEISRQNVHFELEDGQLVYKGLADPAIDAVSDTVILADKEAAVSTALIKAMRDTCASLGIPFYAVHLPDRRTNVFDSLVQQELGPGHYLDLAKIIDMHTIGLPMDGHPNPKGHRLIARQLLPFMQKWLQPLSTDSIHSTVGQIKDRSSTVTCF